MEIEILDFIQRRFAEDCHWLDGNCFYFAKILQIRFPVLKIYYEPIAGHFLAGINNIYFDWHGIYELKEKEKPILFKDILIEEEGWGARIIHDCID